MCTGDRLKERGCFELAAKDPVRLEDIQGLLCPPSIFAALLHTEQSPLHGLYLKFTFVKLQTFAL